MPLLFVCIVRREGMPHRGLDFYLIEPESRIG